MPKYNAQEVEKFKGVRNAARPFATLSTVDRLLPNPAERNAYYEWAAAERANQSKRWTMEPQEFIRRVDTHNFFDEIGARPLVMAMWRCPLLRPGITVGYDGDNLYRLFTEPRGLKPHPEARVHRRLGDWTRLSEHLLGLNSSFQPNNLAGPTERKQASLPEIAFSSGRSHPKGPGPGFIFFQLGNLRYARLPPGRRGWPRDNNGPNLNWRLTGFNLVAKVTEAGTVDGIFAVYNMFPADEWGPHRNPITGDEWGVPPTPTGEEEPKQFSCARVARHLGDFGPGYRIIWTDRIEHQVRLGYVVHTKAGRLARTETY